MNKWIPYVVPAVFSFVVGYILSYWNHGLTVRRDAAGRRRDFRAAIRLIAIRFDDVNWMTFYKTYQASVPDVKNLCAKISDDIGFWSKSDFARYRDLYCGFKELDLELPRAKTPAGMEEYMKANKVKRDESKILLLDTLERIAKCAA